MMDLASDEQEQLVNEIKEFASSTRIRYLSMKQEKESVQNSALAIPKGREMAFNRNGL